VYLCHEREARLWVRTKCDIQATIALQQREAQLWLVYRNLQTWGETRQHLGEEKIVRHLGPICFWDIRQ